MLFVLLIFQLPIIGISLFLKSVMIFGIINLGLFVIYLIPFLRFKLIASPIYYYLIRYLPKISKTEQESLTAGDPWLGKESLKLKPKWQKIYNYKSTKLSEDEQDYLEQVVTKLCELSDDWEIGENNAINQEIFDFIKIHKLWGLIVPRQYGGLDFSALAQSRIISLIASKSINIAIVVMVPNSLGPAELLIKYGTEEQKQKYLPELASGDEIPCFGLTSSVAGSDASSIIDNGIVCYGQHEGSEVLGIRLNWSKRYITLAPIATIMSIAIKLYDPDRLLSVEEDIGITLCLIPASHKGVSIGSKHLPMNLKFPNGSIEGKDVFIPIEWVIGGRDCVGRGWAMLMECLSVGRSLSLPALTVGMSQKCLLTTSAYCMVREQFNLPVAVFEGVQEKLARIAGFTYIVDAANTMTIDALGLSIHPSVESAIVKYHLTEIGRSIINDTMDVFGGKSIQFGPNNFIGYCYQALPISITVEGANILTRNLIIFGQGIMMFHPYLLEEVGCFKESTKKNILKFEQSMTKHSYRVCALIIKNIYYNLIKLFYPILPKQFRRQSNLNYFGNSLAILSEFVLIYFGKKFKAKEKISANLGDILSYIYISYAVIRYNLENDNLDDTALFNWSTGYLQFKILEAFSNVFILIPSWFCSTFIKSFLFPYGIILKRKYFKYDKAVVDSMGSDTEIRKYLTRSCHRGDDTKAINVIEEAFLKLPIINPILKKLSKNGISRSKVRTIEQIGVLTAAGKFANIINLNEIQELENYTRLVSQAIQVDQF